MKEQQTHTILVVDDMPANIEIIIESFIDCNYNIIAATNGEMACALAQSNKPDLIILDWQMPGMTGLDVIKGLKKDPDTKEITIIMATAVHTDAVHLKQALEAGAFDFVRKPFDKIELDARVKSALDFRLAQQQIQKQQQDLYIEKEKRLNDSLESQKRELVAGAMQILRQNEINLALMDELAKLLNQTDDKTNDAIRQLINKYKIMAVDSNWEDFKTRFEQLHVSFYDKLNQYMQNLTPTDIKICAFLRMNMSLNEISAITLQSVETIRKAKFRLRKKLNFQDNSELTNFLVNL